MSDVSQAQRPERQESPGMEAESPYINKVEEEFVHIKEEQEEYFNRVVNPHVEEQQQPHPLKKEAEDPPYVKVEVVDIPKWTDEPLKGEDGGVSEASRGTEPQNISNSSSKEGSQADNLIAQPSASDDFTSLSLFCHGGSCVTNNVTQPTLSPFALYCHFYSPRRRFIRGKLRQIRLIFFLELMK
ncbi:uncharacterized protein LOC130928055 isoform X3 [Corythoichthys intestinalis]|uniref:uncharacterized protein LOC130928055 isoform X3 n=1 Tax=Corythoichthys intestinalis TaxID=161448 RepID=UPI0025A52FAC|nr:uncharacterized protein LOC130928055 isoform X3 [Corythoichthys intestinalis]